VFLFVSPTSLRLPLVTEHFGHVHEGFGAPPRPVDLFAFDGKVPVGGGHALVDLIYTPRTGTPDQ